MQPIKVKQCCATCGGENVKRDAWASWCDETQSWEIDSVFDNAWCDDCECECSIDRVEIEATGDTNADA